MLKLLVVEDHALVREGLLQTLRKLDRGVACTGVSDAEEAIALLEKSNEDYDLCLLDLMLPGRSGFQVLRDIRVRQQVQLRGSVADGFAAGTGR